ncbi:hypothetical protein Lyticum_00126 [Lyticum sinuosum]|uniref:Uncharacterized protein n=1 Tax=Lyticum sinuosum TaxID=1332059 RepID=A0AAE5AHP2_9RICK|nr:hypothetical protein [Lyticum sinuosum]
MQINTIFVVLQILKNKILTLYYNMIYNYKLSEDDT